MDVAFVIRQRLAELGCEQRELARAAEVTESYISQLLTRKKAPPASHRTDLYEKLEHFLHMPLGELARLADLQRQEELQGKLGEVPEPLFQDVRTLILRKCASEQERYVRAIFEKQPFGELERLVTQKLLDVVKNVAREELASEVWLRRMAELGERSYEQIRVIVLDFLDADIFTVSAEHCEAFLEPLLESWSIDLETFGMDIVLNRRLVPEHLKQFAFMEKAPEDLEQIEPGLVAFLKDSSLSGEATEEEIAFLKRLKFKGKRPLPLYYYRELQNLRDPLHFRTP
ncbi:MAG: helix-turn-helix domain-containing protein [Candidatus Tectimicrobiota bacterium]